MADQISYFKERMQVLAVLSSAEPSHELTAEDIEAIRYAFFTIASVKEVAEALLYTADRIRPVSAMTVYGVSPACDVETLYVEDCLCYASTTFPSNPSGADACRFPITHCYADRAVAQAIADMNRE